MSVLKIKDQNGNWVDIPAIKGANGRDGAIQYQAGKNISLENNTISTSALNESEVQDLIDTSIEALGELGFTPTVVQTLPTQDIDTHTIYLVPKQDSEQEDAYDEWLYINNTWEHIGSTTIDLSNYYTKSEVDAKFYENNATYTIYEEIGTTVQQQSTYQYKLTLKNALALKLANVYDDAVEKNYKFIVINIIDNASTYSTIPKITLAGEVGLMWGNTWNKLYSPFPQIFNPMYGGAWAGQPITLSAYLTFATDEEGKHILANVSQYINMEISTSNRFLAKDNATSFYPNGYYQPATKIYSDTVPLTLSNLSKFSSSKTYQEGDYVYRSDTNLTIYRCNTNGTTGSWDATKWDEKTYMEYLSDTLVGGALNGSY